VRERDPRLDRLKAIAISLVLVWHLHPIYVEGSRAVDEAVRFFDFEMSLTAVPTFLLVSFALFYRRAGAGGLAARLWRLFQIYLFWTLVQIALAGLAGGRPLRPSWQWVYLGGPDLPHVGGSVFYYLFDLMILTALAAGFARLKEPAQKGVAWVVVAASLAAFEATRLAHREMAYWRPDNFIIYVPIAYYFSRLPRYRWGFFGAYLLSAARDVWRGDAPSLVYGRVTIVLGALALAGFVLHAPVRAGRWTVALSRWALGLFAIHKYWQWACIVAKDGHALNLTLAGATVHLNALVIFAATLALTAATIALAARTPLRRFIA
jgi:hypothetical protein